MINKILVLLAEDDEELAETYTFHLKCSHFEVMRAKSGGELVDLVVKHNPEIILSDTELANDTYGDEACRFLLEKGAIENVLLVAMSKVRDNDERWKGLCHEFIYKGGINDLGFAIRDMYLKFIDTKSPLRYKVFPEH